MAKAIRQQAATAERVAVNTADTYAANQMRSLAEAFRTQAEIIRKKKKKKKNELLHKGNVQARRTPPSQEDRRSCP
jgi:G3E family GTPase